MQKNISGVKFLNGLSGWTRKEVIFTESKYVVVSIGLGKTYVHGSICTRTNF